MTELSLNILLIASRMVDPVYNTIQYKNEYYYSGINPVEFRGHSKTYIITVDLHYLSNYFNFSFRYSIFIFFTSLLFYSFNIFF